MSRNHSNHNENEQSLLSSSSLAFDDAPIRHDINDLLEKAGGFGRFQWLIILYSGIFYHGMNFFIYNLAYLELVPNLKCMYTGETEFRDCQDSKDVCNKDLVQDWYPNFEDNESFHNWMTDQNLYCKSSFMIGLFGSLYFLGFALNGVLLKLSDTFGRKAIMIAGSAFQAAICFAFYFSDNYIVYYVCVFLSGISIAKSTTIYIYVTESMPQGKQIYPAAFCFGFDFMFPMMICTAYFYFGGKNWKISMIPSMVLQVLSFIVTFYVPESPRYLYARQDWKKLRKVLKTISKVNGVAMTIDDKSQENTTAIINSDSLLERNERSSLLDSESIVKFSIYSTLRDTTVVINFAVTIISFCCVAFSFYMISFYLKYTGGNIYMNTTSSAVSGFVSNFVAGGIQQHFGTKNALIFCFAISTLFAFPLLFTLEEIQIAICVFISRFFNEGAFCVVYFMNPELFPPLFVPFSLSVCSFISKLITINAPEVAEMQPRQIPIIVFCVVCTMAMIPPLFLRKPNNLEASKINKQDESENHLNIDANNKD